MQGLGMEQTVLILNDCYMMGYSNTAPTLNILFILADLYIN